MSLPASPEAESTILFRPSKKRKIYRQRDRDTSPPPESSPAPPMAQSIDELIASAAQPEEVEGVVVPVSEILRLRKAKKRTGGVEFRASDGHRGGTVQGKEDEEVGEDEQQESVEGGLVQVQRRFMPQMGIVGEAVDRHMMAYIDTELAKRRLLESQTLPAPTNHGVPPMPSHSQTLASAGHGQDLLGKSTQKQPATLGKLHEIDLGEEVRERNMEETDRARRRLNGETVLEDEANKKPVKVRLGRDGKPWRGRKRRGSDDVKRDQLVEALLRENRLEIYDEPAEEPAAVDDDQGADERMAEAFRKEFMDAVSARSQKKKEPTKDNRSAAAKKEEELMKGPKLGGSRSARAAMREQMLKAALAKK